MNDYTLNKFNGSIFMVGFMASGKSTIGKLLAENLHKEFCDLDKYIEEKEKSSIKEIFEEKGEAYFRELEWKYLLSLTRSFTGVLSLGGGALHNQHVVDHLKLHGLLIFLEVPLEVVVERVKRNKKRPIVLNNDGTFKSDDSLFEELKTLYSARKNYYLQAQIRHNAVGSELKSEHALALIEKIKRYV